MPSFRATKRVGASRFPWLQVLALHFDIWHPSWDRAARPPTCPLHLHGTCTLHGTADEQAEPSRTKPSQAKSNRPPITLPATLFARVPAARRRSSVQFGRAHARGLACVWRRVARLLASGGRVTRDHSDSFHALSRLHRARYNTMRIEMVPLSVSSIPPASWLLQSLAGFESSRVESVSQHRQSVRAGYTVQSTDGRDSATRGPLDRTVGYGYSVPLPPILPAAVLRSPRRLAPEAALTPAAPRA